MFIRPVSAVVATLVVMLSLAVEAQSTRTFKARLSAVPVPAFSANVVGTGSVTATLSGMKLTVNGTFDGLASPATAAHLHKSPKPGIRGPALFDLTVTQATKGTITGAFDLTAAQVQEISQNRYYVQLHSEKAPDGNLWGWLMAQENRR
jgi:CHRD domain